MTFTPPPSDCSRCPRLVAFRSANQTKFPHFFNGAVPSFGALSASMVVVGLAPGLKGANATGRPFTGDYAGLVLYEGLARAGMAEGVYRADPQDGFSLLGVRITNAVRCVPPENKPLPEEVRQCHPFLVEELAAMPQLKGILSLGQTSHLAVLRTLGLKAKDYPFAHGAVHRLTLAGGRRLWLLDSYHTSRYNIQTRRLTTEMFDGILAQAKGLLAEI